LVRQDREIPSKRVGIEMKIETDPKVVEKLAERQEEDNWRFRSFLKGIDLESEEVDDLVHRLYDRVAKEIDCLSCANCCREMLPILGEEDVARLAGALDISREETGKRFLIPGEDEGTFTFRNKPCPFLSGNKCTVYESRPDDCRSFPHLHKEGFVFRTIQAIENCSICPIVFNVFERLKEELWLCSDEDWEEDDY
jgi:Fe-S-cluster containining protein